MSHSTDQVEVIADAKSVLGQAPFGVCLLDEREQIIWTNATLRDQLGLDIPADTGASAKGGGSEGEYFDDLPITVEQHSGLCQPVHRPSLRLRMAVTPLREGIKLAAFTDVTDLTSGVAGYVEILREIANTDSATGLRNRAQINRDLLAEINRSRRYGNALSIIRITLGGNYNALADDKKNHVLRNMGVQLADNLRAIDYAGQWSDGEFLVILPETVSEGAERLAHKIETMLAQLDNLDSKCRVAEWQASDDITTLLERASAN